MFVFLLCLKVKVLNGKPLSEHPSMPQKGRRKYLTLY